MYINSTIIYYFHIKFSLEYLVRLVFLPGGEGGSFPTLKNPLQCIEQQHWYLLPLKSHIRSCQIRLETYIEIFQL